MGYVSFGWIGEDREITVKVVDGVWHTVHIVNGEPDKSLTRTHGSNTLATPWTEETDRETVIQELSARNPHAKIC